MLASTLHKGFKMAIDKEDTITVPSFTAIEIDYWLNTAQDRIVNNKLAGTNMRRIGFEQDQKRIDDLQLLISSYQVWTNGTQVGNESLGYEYYSVELPLDYMHLLGVDVIVSAGSKRKQTQPIESTIENITSRLNNSLSEHKYHNGPGKPLQIIENNKLSYYTDGNYSLDSVMIKYMKKPARILSTSSEELTHFPDYMWSEVIALAARLALANTGDSRYSAYSQESQLAE